MSKIYYVPDVHLQEYSPRSRKDAYPSTILEKLESIVNIVNENNGLCIFLGDIFNATNLPMIYFYRVVEVFKKFNSRPHVIWGNHDMFRNNAEMSNRTPLGLLMSIGLVKQLESIEVDNTVINGFNFTDVITNVNKDSKKNVCVAHCFYEDNFAETHNLHVDDCIKLGYDDYILGHDHTPYEDIHNDKYSVYRIGSLSRGTANDNQMTRDKVYILEYDTVTESYNKVSIPCLPAKDVFKESVFLRKEEKKNMDKILDNLVFTSNDSIYDVLDRSEQKKEVKDIVEQYLQAAGIFRENLN